MEAIAIRARNNLNIPVRLTLIRSGENEEILITIGEEGTTLKAYYSVCVDADIPPNKEWEEIGSLHIDTKSVVSFLGLSK